MIELREFATTLAIGAFLISGLIIILYLVFSVRIHGVFFTEGSAESGPKFKAWALLLIPALTFGLGMLVEDWSDHHADPQESRSWENLYTAFGLLTLPKEEEMRKDTLFGKEGERWSSRARALVDILKILLHLF